MIYKYNAVLENGRREAGIISAADVSSVQLKLAARKMTILKIEAVESSIADSPYINLTEREACEKTLASFLISDIRIELVLRELGVMLTGGIAILPALQTIALQSGYFLSRALFCIANSLQTGRSFSESLQRELAFLGNSVIGLITVGEANGDIARMCTHAAELLERRRHLRGQLLQALAYPALVLLVTGCIVIFLMVNVIPKIIRFLDSRSVQLPWATQTLVDSVYFLRNNGVSLLLIPVICSMIFWGLRKNPKTARFVDYTVLYIPFLGKVLRAFCNTLWCRTMGLLLQSGISIIPALEFSSAALGNNYYRSELLMIEKIIAQGHSLSIALRVSGLFPFISLAEAMSEIGEKTGRVDEGLLKTAELYEADLQRRITFLGKMIEPVLFIVIGGIVGFVYIAFFLGLMAASAGK